MSNLQPSTFAPDTHYWEDKRVLVTGGAGFLGSFVVEKLKQRGAAEIIVPHIEEYDLVNIADIHRLFDKVMGSAHLQPSSLIVIHLAALVGGVGANRARPADFYYINLMMGTQLMHEAWVRGVDKFVAIGSICAYPKYTPVPFREENLWEGYPEETNAPYGLAKKMLLVQAQAYRDQYGFNAIYLLPVNLYGPGDHFEFERSHVLSALVRRFVEAKRNSAPSVVVWGTGNARREFLHVYDLADACLFLLRHFDMPEIINVGSGEDFTIRALAEMVGEWNP